MEILVLQHIKIEDPGYIKDLMIKDGVNITTIELDEGEKIPNKLNFFDGMLCMGVDPWILGWKMTIHGSLKKKKKLKSLLWN